MFAVWVDWTEVDTCFSAFDPRSQTTGASRPETLCLNGMAEVVLDDGRSRI